MGYTHYYYIRKDTPENMLKLTANMIQKFIWGKTNTLIANGKMPEIANGFGDEMTYPLIGPDAIKFNGYGNEDSHETFIFPRTMEYYEGKSTGTSTGSKDWYFECCKTARKTYDKYVTGALIIAKSLLGKYIVISSDGDGDDWKAGVAFAAGYHGLDEDMDTGDFVENYVETWLEQGTLEIKATVKA